jgi:hypothetical protein
MALLRLAEWILLATTTQGCNSCNDKIPPRADEAEIHARSASESLGSGSATNSTSSFRCVDQDARPSIACNREGAER